MKRQLIYHIFGIPAVILAATVIAYAIGSIIGYPGYTFLSKTFWILLCLDIIFILVTVSAKKENYSWSLIWGTGFLSGLMPPPFFLKKCAGTYGSLATLPLIGLIMLSELPWPYQAFLVFVLTVMFYKIGLKVIKDTERELGGQTDYKNKTKYEDQNQIVIDEVVGMLIWFLVMKIMIGLLGLDLSLSQNIALLVSGTTFFRLFDMAKWLPGVKKWNKLKTAEGVLMDDVIAAYYTIFFTACFMYGYLELGF